MKRYGRELDFISIIHPEGKKLETIEDKEVREHMNEEVFTLNSLSIGNQTFIASGMNSFVVRLKNPRIIKNDL